MSHAWGQVKFPNNKIYYFEYNGTSDICCTRLYQTSDELVKNWRGDNQRECRCKGLPDKVEIATSYGDGFFWPGTACEFCMAILDGILPDYDTQINGYPNWWIGDKD